MGAITRRTGDEEAGGYDQLLKKGYDTDEVEELTNALGQVIILNDQDLDPVEGVDIIGWEKNVDGLWIVPIKYQEKVLVQCHCKCNYLGRIESHYPRWDLSSR